MHESKLFTDDWPERYRKVRRGEVAAETIASWMKVVFDSERRTCTTEICFKPDDVAVVLAESWDGHHEYADEDLVGVYVLKDGRFATASGSSDSSGFG